MKAYLLIVIGILQSILFAFVGPFNSGFMTLMCLMAIDYASGLTLAGIFKKSTKTKSGKLSSQIGLKGIAKKVFMIALVGIGNRIDIILGLNTIRNAVLFALCSNELISIIENCGLMGVPIPNVIKRAIDVLNERGDIDE